MYLRAQKSLGQKEKNLLKILTLSSDNYGRYQADTVIYFLVILNGTVSCQKKWEKKKKRRNKLRNEETAKEMAVFGDGRNPARHIGFHPNIGRIGFWSTCTSNRSAGDPHTTDVSIRRQLGNLCGYLFKCA
jgi:hypothetical protein